MNGIDDALRAAGAAPAVPADAAAAAGADARYGRKREASTA